MDFFAEYFTAIIWVVTGIYAKMEKFRVKLEVRTLNIFPYFIFGLFWA